MRSRAGGAPAARRAGIRRLLLEDRVHRLDGRRPREWRAARDHLVENDAEREDVRAGVRRVAADLFGRHVADRSEDRTGGGEVGDGRRGGPPGQGRRRSRQAEVDDLDVTVRGHPEVLRLEVPVRDPLRMRGRQSRGDLDAVLQRLARGQRAGAELVAQRPSLEPLHHRVGHSPIGADVVDRHDVGMGQGRHGPGLPFEARERFGTIGRMARKDLDGDGAIQAAVARFVDFAHPAGAERGEDLVRAEPRSWGEGRHAALDYTAARESAASDFLPSSPSPRLFNGGGTIRSDR